MRIDNYSYFEGITAQSTAKTSEFRTFDMKIIVAFLLTLFLFYLQDTEQSNSQKVSPNPDQSTESNSDSSQFEFDTAYAGRLYREAKVLLEEDSLNLALNKANQSLELRQSWFGTNSLEYSNSLNQLGEIKFKEGNYNSALEIWTRVLEIKGEILPSQHIEIANSHNNIGNALHFMGSYKEAINNHKKALKLRKVHYGEDHPEVAKSYNNLANSYAEKNEIDLALDLNIKALKIHREHSGDKNLYVANTYNNLGNLYNTIGRYDEAVKYHKRALGVRAALFGEEHSTVAASFNNLGLSFDYLGKMDSAYVYHENALELRKKTLGEMHPHVGQSYMNLGTNRVYNGYFQEAINFYSKALDIYNQSYGEINVYTGQVLANLSLGYEGVGDYRKAILYSRKALNILKGIIGENHLFIGVIYNNLATNYYHLLDFERALEYQRWAQELNSRILGYQNLEVAKSFNNIGGILNDMKRYENAISNFDLALEIYRKNVGEIHLLVAQVFGNKAASYFGMLDYKKAQSLYTKTLDIQIRILGERHPEVAKTYVGLARIYDANGNHHVALEYFNKALDALNFKSNSELSDVLSIEELLYVIVKKSNSQLADFKRNESIVNLKNIKLLIEEGLGVLSYQQNNVSSNSKKYYTRFSLPLLENAIVSNLALIRTRNSKKLLQEIFYYCERSKTNLLLESINNSNALKYSGIPDSLLLKEKNIRAELINLEKQRQEVISSGLISMDSIILGLDEKIFDLMRESEDFQELLSNNYPNYYNARYSQKVISVTGVQDSLLGDNQALVEYFVGDSSIFTFTILPDTFYVQQIKKDFPLDEWVESMLHGIYDPYTSKSAEEPDLSYGEAAHKIYKELFFPVDTLLPEGTEIILVPDGILGYIPFDALLTDKEDENSYLIRDHQISYTYSATLQAEMENRQHDRRAKNKVLAFAPSFDQQEYEGDTLLLASRSIDVSNSRNWLGPLQYNDDEVLAISELADAELYLDSLATKDNFLQSAGDYRIVHLSTHGKANDRMGDYSFLAFHDKQDSTESWLYNRELYGLDLNADMVVLSACETGIGELQRGEGIISLARGFSYAGAKSIVTTLWSVNDQSTQKVMELFYGHLKNGMRKDEALRKAKLDYLDKYPNLGTDPYFWAGIIPIGDMSPVNLSSGFNWWWMALALAGLGLVLFLFSRRKAFS